MNTADVPMDNTTVAAIATAITAVCGLVSGILARKREKDKLRKEGKLKD